MSVLGMPRFYSPDVINAARAASLNRAGEVGLVAIHTAVWRLLDDELKAHEAQTRLASLRSTRHNAAQREYLDALSSFIAGKPRALLRRSRIKPKGRNAA